MSFSGTTSKSRVGEQALAASTSIYRRYTYSCKHEKINSDLLSTGKAFMQLVLCLSKGTGA